MLTFNDVIKSHNILRCVETILSLFISNNTLIVVAGENIRINLPLIRLNFEKRPSGIEHLFERRYDAYVIDLECVPFDDLIESLNSQPYFDKTAKFIFIGRAFSDSSVKKISSNYIRNVIFVNYESLEVSSYLLFKEGSLENVNTNLELIGYCSNNEFNKAEAWRNSSTLFPDIIPRKWRQSTIKVLVYFYIPYTMYANSQKRGIEIELLNSILDVIDVSANYTRPYSASSPQLGVDINTSSIILGMGFTNHPRFRHTVTYTTDQLFWFVPSSSPIPKWKYVYKAFSKNVWLIWFFIFLVVSFLWYVTDRIFRKQKQIHYFFIKPFVLLKLSLEQGHNLDYAFSTQRFLMTIIVFLIFSTNAFYKSRFTYLLSGLNFEKGIETFEDIMDANLKLDYYEPYRENFAGNPKFYEYMKKHFRNCTDPFMCTNRTAFKRDMAVLRYRKNIRYVVRSYYTDPESGKPLIQEFVPSVHVDNFSFNILDGHPLFQSIEEILRYFRDNGIVDYFINKYDEFRSLDDTPNIVKISVKDLSGVFIFWIICLLTTIFVFSLEFELHRESICKEQGHNLDYAFSTDRFLMTIIVFLIFSTNAFYKSRFTYLLSGLNFEKGLETFEDIMDANLKLDYYEPYRENFAGNPKFYEYMKKHFLNCIDPFICTNRTAFNRDMAVLRYRKNIRYVVRSYYTDPESGKPLIQEFFPSVQVDNFSFNILDGHPLFQSIEEILRYFRDNGIVDYFINKYDEFRSQDDTSNIEK
ncbi:hypothetical protein HHI36_012293 [Cryptolaemus montrouzieri]|uniref:Ionotropic receptor n=1 Tax=Cryptolaemus montrouzieri TaxID=559131 RepID=A0ABD2NF14_9CUCU